MKCRLRFLQEPLINTPQFSGTMGPIGAADVPSWKLKPCPSLLWGLLCFWTVFSAQELPELET